MLEDIITRRSILKVGVSGAALSLAAPFVFGNARAAGQLTVADPGGPYSEAFRKGFYDPFEKKTGIKVTNVARDPEPVAQFKAVVETKSYIWDVGFLASPARQTLSAQGLLHPMGLSASDFPDLIEGSIFPDWLGTDVYTTVSAFRTDRFSKGMPQNMTDFWDVEGFPGRRGMYKSPVWTLEQVLLADGVSPAELYPLDVERAFKKLTEIKPYINVWWTSGAQSTQLLQTNEVDWLTVFNSRAQTIIDAGGPVKINWAQGMYGIEGWAIPRDSPKADIAHEFIRFCADAAGQAATTGVLAYGPTNRKAFELISLERAKVLSTYKDNISQMVLTNDQWWQKNRSAIQDRFNEWMLG